MTDPFEHIPSAARGLRPDLQAIIDRDWGDREQAIDLLLPQWMGGRADEMPELKLRSEQLALLEVGGERA